MKSRLLPKSSHPNHGRAAAVTAAAAALLCLAAMSLGVAASSARVLPPQTPVPAGSTVSTTTSTTTTVTTPTPTPPPGGAAAKQTEKGGRRVKLHYMRAGTSIAAALNKIAEPKGSVLNGAHINVVGEDEVIIIGDEEQRKLATRIIATLDLPRPGVHMELWGVQISSKRSEDLAEVMRRVRAEIDRTQREVRDTFMTLQELARAIPDDKLDDDFKFVLEDRLHYESALDTNRPLSLSDILLRLIAAEAPVGEAQKMAQRLDEWLRRLEERRRREMPAVGTKQCKSKSRRAEATLAARPTHFTNFFWNRGLEYAHGAGWVPRDPAGVERNTVIGKTVLLDFALNYERLVHDPDRFDPYYLQQSAGALNVRLQSNIDALNQDIEEIFVVPTLDRIRLIVSEFCDVEYAQVGRTTVASLSGAQSVVSAGSVNTFDFFRPLTLNDFLKEAKAITDNAAKLDPGPAATNRLGTIPFSEVVGLIGALGQDRAQTRKTTTEFSVTITPNVLRDMTSAELDVDLKTGDPLAGGTQQEGTPQFTRVSDHDVKTKVYVNALDFFDLSAFGSQATMSGGRAYVPIVGPLWRGLFGEAPVIGEFLSWKRPPQTVYSQSLALTTSFITPTAMGVALLVPTDIPDAEKEKWGTDEKREERKKAWFEAKKEWVNAYGDCLFKRKGDERKWEDEKKREPCEPFKDKRDPARDRTRP